MTHILERTKFGKELKIWNYVVVYDSELGDNVQIGSFAEVGGAKIGNNTRIGNGVFIPPGTVIGNNCFIGPKTCFTNDKYPSIKKVKMRLEGDIPFAPLGITVKDRANIGANVTILPGILIGEDSLIGGGSVVTRNVPPNEIWRGNPARKVQ